MDTQPVAKRPSAARRLSRRYVAAFSVIAALALVRANYELSLLRGMSSDGQRVKLSARQAMLTQRMVSAGFGLLASPAQRAQAAFELGVARDQWRIEHRRLVAGNGTDTLPPAGAELKQQLQRFEPQVARIDGVVDRLLGAYQQHGAGSQMRRLADSLSTERREFVADLDALTDRLAKAQREHMLSLQSTTVAFTCLLWLLLAFTHIIVFRPALRSLAALLRSQRQDNARLAEQTAQLQLGADELSATNVELEAQREELLRHHDEMMHQQELLEQQRETLVRRTRELTRLSAIMDATPDPVAVYSVDGKLEYANEAALQILQPTEHGSDWRRIFRNFSGWAARHLHDTSIPYAIEHGAWQGESALRGSDGEDRPVLQTVLAHYGADGKVRTISTILHDITEQKLMQRELAEREARNRAVIESLAEGMVVQDSDGCIVAWNDSAERILGLSGDQLAGRTSMDPDWCAIDPMEVPIPGDRHPIVRARVAGEHIDGELQGVRRGDGSLVWLSVNARPMYRVGHDDHPGAVATFTDVTQQRATARELEMLSVVARQSDYAVVTTDESNKITWVNPAWEKLTGYTVAEVTGRSPVHVSEGPHTDAETIARRRSAMRAGESFTGELLHYRKDGTPYWIELTITPLHDAQGKTTGHVSLSRDITTRRAADRERHQLAAALAVTADGIAITGVGGALEFVNHAYARMHTAHPEELIATSWSSLYEAEESRRLVATAIPEVTSVGFWQGESTGRRIDGTLYPQELSLTLLPQGGLVAVARDVTERQAAQEQLRHHSVHDDLTGLFNRRGFMSQAERLLDLAARQGTPCALLYGDLDGFKSINDSFGHAAGDAALIDVGTILSSVMRTSDLVARLGGDEFTVFAFDVAPESVALLLDRISATIEASNEARIGEVGCDWLLGMSLGVAYFDPDMPSDVEGMLRVADAAQYVEKKRRKAVRASPRAA